MLGPSRRQPRRRRSPSRKSCKTRNRVLRSESLEPRMLLSGNGLSLLGIGISLPAATVGVRAPVNAAPTLAQAISVNGNAAVTGKSASLAVLGADDGGEAKLVYNWSVMASPAGGTATFSVNGTNGAKHTTVTFSKAGTYTLSVKIVDAGGLSASSLRGVVVSPTLTSIGFRTASGQTVSPGSTMVVPGVSQAITAQGLDQFGTVLASQPTFTWSIGTLPSGAPKPTLAARGASATVTFGKAGTYGLAIQAKAAGGVSVSGSLWMAVSQVASGIKTPSTAPLYLSGTSLQLVLPTFTDEFGNAMTTPPALIWSTTSLPSGATAPNISTNGSVATVTFGMAGSYTLNARTASTPNLSFATTVVVSQTLTSIAVTPNAAYLLPGATQQFTARALDQFAQAMATQPTFAWSASNGTISAAGLFTASNSGTGCTVTAKSGSATGVSTITFLTNSGNLQNAALAKLVPTLDADGSINRQDMMQILRSTGTDGVVDATELSDLRKILSQSAMWNIADYVQALAGDVVNGNLANATFLGQALGNLAVGSSATQLNNLVDKWFLGADHPALCNSSVVYKSTAGSLFPQTPSHADEYQGQLGDCYFISALGTLADSNPTAIRNMFIDNGDGTFTVRFYTGTYGTIYNYSDGSIGAGFTNNVGTADYVTVDRMLPVGTTGILAYADYGANYTNSANSLWIPLAEKAYAQWNQTGKEGRDGLNAYASTQGGWMATVDAQVLGHNATDYIMTSTQESVAINALAAHKAVTIGTLQWSGTQNGLYASHAYAIIGYNASTDKFTLYNPWGSNQPGALSWSQLQASCSQLCVAATTGSLPMSGAVAAMGLVKTSLLAGASGAVVSMSPSAPDAVTFTQADAAPAAASGGQFSAASNASRRLFEIMGSRWMVDSQQSGLANPMQGILSARLVDAMFATDSYLLQSAVCANLV